MRASTPDKSRAKLARTVQARSTRAYQRLSPAERRARNKKLYARAKKRYQVLSPDEKRAHDEKKNARAKKHYYVLSLDEGRARRLASRERSCAKDRKHDNTRRIARVAAKKACREIAKLRRLREMRVASGTSRVATRALRDKLMWKCTSRRKRLIKCSEIICCRQQRKIAIWRVGHFYF